MEEHYDVTPLRIGGEADRSIAANCADALTRWRVKAYLGQLSGDDRPPVQRHPDNRSGA